MPQVIKAVRITTAFQMRLSFSLRTEEWEQILTQLTLSQEQAGGYCHLQLQLSLKWREEVLNSCLPPSSGNWARDCYALWPASREADLPLTPGLCPSLGWTIKRGFLGYVGLGWSFLGDGNDIKTWVKKLSQSCKYLGFPEERETN